MTVITVLGYKCVLCGFLYQAIKEAAEERGWQVEVAYSRDQSLIAAHQITDTPAIMIDDRVIHAGYGGTKRTIEMLEEILKTDVFPPDHTDLEK